jgi:hypothetical protein
MSLERTKYFRELRRCMIEHFDLDELQTLVYDLSVDWEELPGDRKSTKSQALIQHLAQRGQLSDLVTLLKEERPQLDWPDVPLAEQQVEDEKSLIPDSVRESALQGYLERMSLLITESSVPVGWGYRAPKGDVILTGRRLLPAAAVASANAYTESVIPRLDKPRLLIVVEYLSGLGLSQLIDLSGFDLTGVELKGANLSGVNFTGACLSSSDLSEADFSNAILHGANLRGANLHKAKLDNADLRGASYDAATQWPRRFNPTSAGAIQEG